MKQIQRVESQIMPEFFNCVSAALATQELHPKGFPKGIANCELVLALVLLLILSNFFSSPAYASVCRNYDGHQVCILSINRSAKNYWEYRAIISVDGVTRPLEVYNCRQKIRIQKDGTVLAFENKDPGQLICNFLKKS